MKTIKYYKCSNCKNFKKRYDLYRFPEDMLEMNCKHINFIRNIKYIDSSTIKQYCEKYEEKESEQKF